MTEFETWWTENWERMEDLQGLHLVNVLGLKAACKEAWEAGNVNGYNAGYDDGYKHGVGASSP